MASSAECGQAALRHLDALLAQKPKADQALFSQCTRELSALRRALTERARAPDASAALRTALAHTNAVLSVVMAGHFPLGDLPWEELVKARGWLAGAVEAAG